MKEERDESIYLPTHQKVCERNHVLPPKIQQRPVLEAHGLHLLRDLSFVGWGREVRVVDLALGSVFGENAVEEVGLDGFQSAEARALKGREEEGGEGRVSRDSS